MWLMRLYYRQRGESRCLRLFVTETASIKRTVPANWTYWPFLLNTAVNVPNGTVRIKLKYPVFLPGDGFTHSYAEEKATNNLGR